VPGMHRKRSSDGRRSGIHGRNSGGVHSANSEKPFQNQWSWPVFGKSRRNKMATSKEREVKNQKGASRNEDTTDRGRRRNGRQRASSSS